jgi:aspartyl-tRNA synthetase
MCGRLTKTEVGKATTVMGWAAKRRDFGSLIFVDLRDRTGVVQVVFDESKLDKKTFRAVQEIRNEYVLAICGTVRERDKDTINDKLSTGEIEIAASSLKILSESETPPFAIEENSLVNESTRLRYRYLDLRRPDLSGNLIVRDKISKAARDYFAKNDFLEIETPFLGKSTPEGARDYLVPSRVHNGAFYALPQSPQLYKQLLMIGGFDRDYQIARCFRDEDLRANRQPEFTQIDVEMSFVEDEGDVMNMAEGLVKRIFKDAASIKLKTPFKKMTYKDAMDRFGSDKPDTRFGMELINISDIVKNCGFQVFSGAVKNGGSVRVINAKGFEPRLARRDIDALADFAKTYKAKGLAWIAFSADGIKSAITKFLSETELSAIIERTQAKTGDILFFSADTDSVVFNTLGALRLHLAEGADLINKDIYDVLWVVDFPLLEYSEEGKRYVACHHPFTSPKNEDLSLLETAPERTRAKAYDLVINGQEAGGGSIRIHRVDVQSAMFKALGFSQEQIEQRFGFFVNAFKYGAPPHGGIAFGLDRLTMLLTKTESIKDVVAFPKVQNASCLMTQAPDTVEQKQLKELGLVVKNE